MAWARTAEGGITGQRIEFGLIDRIRRHDLFPFGPFAVPNLDRHRATEGKSVSNATEDPDLVALELHAGPTTCAEATSSEVEADLRGRDLDAGGEPLGDSHQGRTMRLACSQPTHHGSILPGRTQRARHPHLRRSDAFECHSHRIHRSRQPCHQGHLSGRLPQQHVSPAGDLAIGP